MNLETLSQKLENHLTDQDIQDAQELLDETHQQIVDMRGELVEAQAEIARLKVRMAELDRLYVTQGFERSDLTLTHNK